MAEVIKPQIDAIGVKELSHDNNGSNPTEEPDAVVSEQKAQPEKNALTSNLQDPGDVPEYVNGHPIIKNGKYLLL